MDKFIITPKEDKAVTMTIRIDRTLQERYARLRACALTGGRKSVPRQENGRGAAKSSSSRRGGHPAHAREMTG